MEELERDPAAVYPYPEIIPVAFPFVDLLAGIVDVRLHDGGQTVRFQIEPEHPFVQGQTEGRDPFEGIRQGALEQSLGPSSSFRVTLTRNIAAQSRVRTGG